MELSISFFLLFSGSAAEAMKCRDLGIVNGGRLVSLQMLCDVVGEIVATRTMTLLAKMLGMGTTPVLGTASELGTMTVETYCPKSIANFIAYGRFEGRKKTNIINLIFIVLMIFIAEKYEGAYGASQMYKEGKFIF
ncbi:hypothetical protein G4B88_025843 [Cannabis sativa]|uniref:Uncharacterized protein n=1 Tax=Cannabis sativa TaxID=3483 RepID=A0A7J6G867_CANSA|nr:hypothetical protein G4B88_025843 [Cannabis sativa]